MSKLAQHQQQWLHSLTRRIARDYQVELGMVRQAGEVDKCTHYTLICVDCRLREVTAPRFFEPLEPNIAVRASFLVELLPKLRSIDNVTHQTFVVLCGQCQDCGQVYFVYAEMGKRNDQTCN